MIGRSEIVGRPTAMLLLQESATVTMCHSRTADLAGHVRRADIVVAAVGIAGLVKPDWVKPGAALLDVGVTRTDEGIKGDIDPACAEVAGFLTPMPGGTGPDDHRHAARGRGQGGALPARAPCVPRRLTGTVSRVQ